MKRIIIYLFCCFLLLNCDNKKTEEISNEEIQLKVFSDFDYKSILEKESYQRIDTDIKSIDFRFNFQEEVETRYNYQQIDDAETKFAHNDKPMKQSVDSNCILIIKSKGDGTSDIVLKDVVAIQKIDFGMDDEEIKENKVGPNTIAIQGLNEDGFLSTCDDSQNYIFRILLPVCEKKLEYGKIEKIPLKIPFNAFGSLLYVTGSINIELIEFVRVDNIECAKIYMDIDVSNVDIPEELEGTYLFSIIGKGIYYFDYNNHRFIKAKVIYFTNLYVKTKKPEFDISDDFPDESFPDDMENNMENKTIISLNIIK